MHIFDSFLIDIGRHITPNVNRKSFKNLSEIISTKDIDLD